MKLGVFPAYWKNRKHTEEYKQKMSETMKRKVWTSEQKERIRKIGLKRKGLRLSQETKLKLRLVNLGKEISVETRKKISESQKRIGNHIIMTDSVKDKLRIAHLGKKLSREHKLKISNGLIGKMPLNISNSGVYSNILHGTYDINGKQLHFRSKWEANYALYLDFLKSKLNIKDWLYEPDVFIFDKIKFGTRSYRPDFKVYKKDGEFEYHEVKGYMDKKSNTKLKRMKKYYPKIKIVLIGRDEYEALRKWNKLLNWY